ncbi:MAG TPA: 5-(carboxyamino)imidazole ribonucleotide mutase [Methanoregulaceae archaeon]|jgi:5-(carboxyamino)imidazole ribonucleotide mutase|nr:5-(carboxyamino)imidazole ribonucleotide mutase [Methanoregulaceae archaeon]NLH26176.1 5-(carboxyamino)imidazole ribonucleotide mutase [Methanomicrobiales archaeon]HNB03563.1 5-(carboxyamino)imidazole ribonucleotide mutase [Methanoregulaceae archaeon]HNI42607.1 5-(carboxyamino)imidazole ribonucleotide mutase [Methanoregulaceae archaeon]HNJ80584.1 5-(carboxyamino)imidazole ribonucleotide mutase [Methanoregulaceae archaeon]
MVEVAILSGSASDAAIVEKAAAVLEEHGISYEVRVISAHRDPDVLDEYVKKSDCRVFIAIAGLSAALPGVVSSKTERPVIGVPVSGKLMGLDALLSIVQMPKGVPVACVGIDSGENAALLACRILETRRGREKVS